MNESQPVNTIITQEASVDRESLVKRTERAIEDFNIKVVDMSVDQLMTIAREQSVDGIGSLVINESWNISDDDGQDDDNKTSSKFEDLLETAKMHGSVVASSYWDGIEKVNKILRARQQLNRIAEKKEREDRERSVDGLGI